MWRNDHCAGKDLDIVQLSPFVDLRKIRKWIKVNYVGCEGQTPVSGQVIYGGVMTMNNPGTVINKSFFRSIKYQKSHKITSINYFFKANNCEKRRRVCVWLVLMSPHTRTLLFIPLSNLKSTHGEVFIAI